MVREGDKVVAKNKDDRCMAVLDDAIFLSNYRCCEMRLR